MLQSACCSSPAHPASPGRAQVKLLCLLAPGKEDEREEERFSTMERMGGREKGRGEEDEGIITRFEGGETGKCRRQMQRDS